MALADYRLCDVCGGKAFYDANLNYEESTADRPSYRVAGDARAFQQGTLDYLGDWAVLCSTCAQTHKTMIVQREDSAAQAELTRLRAVEVAAVSALPKIRALHADYLRACTYSGEGEYGVDEAIANSANVELFALAEACGRKG